MRAQETCDVCGEFQDGSVLFQQEGVWICKACLEKQETLEYCVRCQSEDCRCWEEDAARAAL
jgi:ribosomal protein L37AE/L43A